jgi:transposase-like protein
MDPAHQPVFTPPFCPYPNCRGPANYERKGFYHRKCDGQDVQRFQCLACGRWFSEQTFKLNYRLKRPELDARVFDDLVSKVTQRQSARTLGCNRKAIALRLRLFGVHCRAFHRQRLAEALAHKQLHGRYQLDEAETFEHNRRLAPVTAPVLIEAHSYFIVHAATGDLPARKPLSPLNQLKLQLRELERGKRKNESRFAVKRCWSKLDQLTRSAPEVLVSTDRKTMYASGLKGRFGGRLRHRRVSSKEPRGYDNPLFPINHTLAMWRDGLSRMVRRNWATTKIARELRHHLWVWTAWRNYVRSITNQNKKQSPAMALGVCERFYSVADMLQWRVFQKGVADAA